MVQPLCGRLRREEEEGWRWGVQKWVELDWTEVMLQRRHTTILNFNMRV
jgi:hypothetical protein